MKSLLVIAALLAAGCSAARNESAAENPLPPGYETLSTFTGEIDMDAGTITIRTDPPGPASSASRSGLTLPEGGTTVSIANGSTPARATGTGSCAGYEVLTTNVVLTMNYPSPKFLGGLYAEITTLSGTGAESCNSSAAPTGLSATKGLWAYGSVRQSSKTSTTAWNFKFTSGQRSTFSGRIVGILGDSFTTLPAPYSNDSATIAYARNRMVYAPWASATLAFVGLDGSNLNTPVSIPFNASSLATYLGATALDDLIWFTTYVNASNDEYVGVVKSDGTVVSTDGAPGEASPPGLRGIVVDPTTVNRAWYISTGNAVGWFRSVTFDPVGGTLTLGTTVAITSLQAIAFGPSPNQYIFASSYSGNRIYAYSAANRSLQATITPWAECTGPRQIILGPDDKLWFGQYNAGNGGFCNMNASGTTFVKLTTAANPRCLTVGKSVTGAGSAVWVADYSGRSATELIEGATAYYSVVVPSGTDLRPIAASPAVTTPVEYPAYIWVVTNGGLERLQPQ
jgi:hypothetical protein